MASTAGVGRGVPGVWGILLAGGEGTRFAAQAGGADKLLAVLPDGRSVLQASAATLCARLPQVIAVVPTGRPARAALLERLGCVVLVNDTAEPGLGASLALAARHIACTAQDLVGVVVALGDMPWVPESVVTQVARALGDCRVAAPVHQGRRGHPVGFSTALLPELGVLQGDVGARAILTREDVRLVASADDAVLRDVDVPADLLPRPNQPTPA